MSDPRILGVIDGQTAPLYGAAFTGPASPSPSLPVETVTLPRRHWHAHRIPRQMITLFLQGATLLHCEAGGPTRRISAPARALAFSLRDIDEQMRWESPARFISLTIDDAVLARTSEALCRGGRFELAPSPQVRDEQLASLMGALYQESLHGYAGGRLYIDGIEQALAALLVSRYNALSVPVKTSTAALSATAAQRVVEYMRSHLAEPLSLADLARCTGYSESHFGRLFKASFGVPAHHYLMALRIEQAKQLLRSPAACSILDIALLVGFANAQHFSRIFVQFAGMTPSAFRRAA